MDNAGGSKLCGKGTCHACDRIITTNTFTTKENYLKLLSGSLNYNSEKLLSLLRGKICDDTPYVAKAKTKLRLRFNNY